jgi:hypothetical protein
MEQHKLNFPRLVTIVVCEFFLAAVVIVVLLYATWPREWKYFYAALMLLMFARRLKAIMWPR